MVDKTKVLILKYKIFNYFKRDCPKSRCDITKFPIKNISGALLRIYNNLDVCCKFENCKQFKKMSDIAMHQKNCQTPRCINFDICGNNINLVNF